MKAFFSKYSFIFIWIVVLVVVGVLFVFIVQPSLHPGAFLSSSHPPTTPATTPIPVPPSVSLTIVKTASGNSLIVQWANLPAGTTGLSIFRGMTNNSSSWTFWSTLSLSSGQLAGGNATINLGSSTLDGYSFYIEAVNGGQNGPGGGSASSTVLWTSPVSDPTISTSTPSGNGGSDNGTNSSSTSSGTGSQSSTPSSTPPAQNSSSSPSSTTPTSTANPPSSSGTPYYNPEVQVQGYASGEGNNFWVQYLNKNIEIGWQNLPPNTISAVVLRAADQNGPWTTIFTQQNPDINTAYLIQLVDDTVGSAYYYELSAENGTTTLATYGPVYLSAPTD